MSIRWLLALLLCLALPVLGLAPARAVAHQLPAGARVGVAHDAMMHGHSTTSPANTQATNASADAAANPACGDGGQADPDGCDCGCGMGACAHSPASALPSCMLPLSRLRAAQAVPTLAFDQRADAPAGMTLRPPIG